MKIILSGGGTGGHIYPALTIADEIKKLHPEAEIIFVGTQQGLEKDIIPRYGYPLKFIEVAGFKRSLSFDTLRSFGKLFTGLSDAYGILKNEKPDLVIMDITMPNKTGIEALRDIKASDANAKVIMCSAMGQESMVMEAIKLGALDFIVKPFKPDRIIQAVSKVLG